MNLSIPKRIIQVWGGGTEQPLLCKASAANIRLLNPDFEYVFFDDAGIKGFVEEHFPDYQYVFDGFRYSIQRYDFFRYLVIYRLGGFYFDMDLFLAASVSELLSSGCVFPFEELTVQNFLLKEYDMDWEIGNYAFGASAGHPFLEAVINNCIRAQKEPEWAAAMLNPIPSIFREEFFVLDTTGPGLVSRTLAEYPLAREQVKVLFPDNVCDPKGWHCFGNFGVHLQGGAWRNQKGFLRARLHRLWEGSARKALLRESLKRGDKRLLEFKPAL